MSQNLHSLLCLVIIQVAALQSTVLLQTEEGRHVSAMTRQCRIQAAAGGAAEVLEQGKGGNRVALL